MQQMLWDELAEQKEQGPWGCAEVGKPNLTEANEKEIERKEAEPERVGAEEREREKGEVGERDPLSPSRLQHSKSEPIQSL